ncbi:MAG: hypothetical protein M1825_004165 [Sarcosagium campestre]|nr:MAG: hypothetical protein M1825_004165 [Sarcosagium campestre]
MVTTTSTSSAVTATPTVDSSNLAKGLFTDLGPLLALFGDEVTKQYLSTSLGFMDDLLLALAPIGIMTIIVSATRVGGYPWMKSLIGRARDSPEDEEKEVLSSTSNAVREIWNGHRVIRQSGESQMVELVLNQGSRTDVPPTLCPLVNGFEFGTWVIKPVRKIHQRVFSYALSLVDCRNRRMADAQESEEIELIKTLMKSKAPNLTLNIPIAATDSRHLRKWVVLGGAFQFSVFVFNATVAYRLKWLRAGAIVPPHGFPLWASGTLFLIIGLFLCGEMIEHVTTEYVVESKARDGEGPGPYSAESIVRFQKAIPSMNLPAFVFLQRHKRLVVSQRTFFSGRRTVSNLGGAWQDITTKLFLRDKSPVTLITLLGTGLALAGFILQNLGVRELHFSASITQLIATLALTIIRSFVRRNVGIPPSDCIELRRGGEVAHMMYEMCGIRRLAVNAKCTVLRGEPSKSPKTQLDITAGLESFSCHSTHAGYVDRLFTSYKHLSEFQPEQNELLLQLANKTMDFIFSLALGKQVQQLIVFDGPDLDPVMLNQTKDEVRKSEEEHRNKAGSFILELELDSDLNLRTSIYEKLAALWSFSLHEYHVSRHVSQQEKVKSREFHIVAACKLAEYPARFDRLKEYLGSPMLSAWKWESDGKMTRIDRDGVPQRELQDRLFGLHFIRARHPSGSMKLGEDDVIIAFDTQQDSLAQHLVADWISNYLLQNISDRDFSPRIRSEIAKSSTRYSSDYRFKWENDYFNDLIARVRQTGGVGIWSDLARAAIIPPFLQSDITPPDPA